MTKRKAPEDRLPRGRPQKFKTAEEFADRADYYFSMCEEKEEVATVNGLCLALGICRDTLLEQAKRPDLSDVVKRARMMLEASWEKRLAGPNATGTIFWLKNQGWSDKSELDLGGTLNIKKVQVECVEPGK